MMADILYLMEHVYWSAAAPYTSHQGKNRTAAFPHQEAGSHATCLHYPHVAVITSNHKRMAIYVAMIYASHI